MTKRVVAIMILITWLAPALLSFVPIFAGNYYTRIKIISKSQLKQSHKFISDLFLVLVIFIKFHLMSPIFYLFFLPSPVYSMKKKEIMKASIKAEFSFSFFFFFFSFLFSQQTKTQKLTTQQ
jgi:hypothetical protein